MKTHKIYLISLFLILLFSVNSCTKDPLSPLQKEFPNKEKIAKIPFFPVRGNHETEEDVNYITKSLLPAYGDQIHRYNNSSVNYYFDHNNIRIIAVDQFSEFSTSTSTDLFTPLKARGGDINSIGLKWVESVINSSGSNIDHIFISFHKPAFPRYRHIHDSFDAFPEDRNAFWNMLMRHKNKVKAVLVAHTHHYSRIRVSDPTTVGDASFPNDSNGIYQIDGGTTGKEGDPNTLVEIMVKGKNIYFRTIQAKSPSDNFKIIDTFSIMTDPNDTLPISNFAYISDNRNSLQPFQRNLEEIRDMKINPAPCFGKAEFVVDGGDMDPMQENYEEIYLKVFGSK